LDRDRTAAFPQDRLYHSIGREAVPHEVDRYRIPVCRRKPGGGRTNPTAGAGDDERYLSRGQDPAYAITSLRVSRGAAQCRFHNVREYGRR